MPLTTAIEPTEVYRTSVFTIATFDGKNSALASALQFAHEQRHTIKHLVSPPSKRGEAGFQEVLTRPGAYNLSTDGILVTKEQTAAMYSRDCPITFIMDSSQNEGVLLHCGRPALTPTQHLMNRRYNIITAALMTLTSRGSNVADLSAYITAGICGKCFVHDGELDKQLLEPFLEDYPESVDLVTGGLDLIGVITKQLTLAGLKKENIHHDGECTKEHKGLASKRGGDQDSNLTVAFIN